jgi:hypothetical protein
MSSGSSSGSESGGSGGRSGDGPGGGSGHGSGHGHTNGVHTNGAKAEPAADDDGDEGTGLELDFDPGPPEPPPPAIMELTASCIRFVQAKFGIVLDGTQDTLSLLDGYIRDARPSAAERPETVALLAASIGAYFGEVVRLTFGGTWVTPGGGDHDTWRLCLRHVYLAFNPIGTAYEALTSTEAPGYHAHLELESDDREMLEHRLAALGEVDEDEYYMPTTRFDVISIAVDAIRGRMLEQGLGDITFTPDDYEK